MLSRVRVAVLVASATAAIASAFASTATASTAAPLTWATACASDLDVAGCERSTWIANQLDDRDVSDRSELTAWGVWFLCGLTVCTLFAGKWHQAWRFWRD